MGVVKFRRDAIWTGVLIAVVASGLLVAPLGAEPPDLDDKAVRERIIAEAIPVSELKNVGTSEEPLLTLPGETVGYSGWVKAETDRNSLFQPIPSPQSTAPGWRGLALSPRPPAPPRRCWGGGETAALAVRVRKNCLAVNPTFAPILCAWEW
jgi:hypothetical protein